MLNLKKKKKKRKEQGGVSRKKFHFFFFLVTKKKKNSFRGGGGGGLPELKHVSFYFFFFILHLPLSAHFGYQPSNALFILPQSSHTLLLLSRNSLSSSEALSLISNHIPKPTLQAILFPFFISHTTLCYSNLQVFLFFRSFEFSFKPSVQIS